MHILPNLMLLWYSIVMNIKFNKNILVLSNVIDSEKKHSTLYKTQTHSNVLRYIQYNIQNYYAYPS